MEDKLDCDKENSINSVHKEQLLKYLAWQINPFSLYYDTYHICRTLNIPKQEIESCLKELENDNIIFLLPKEYGKDTLYMLKAEVQLQLLIDIKKSREKPSYVVPPNLYPSTRWKKEEWRIIIQNYLLEKNINDTMPSYVDYEPIRYLLMTMPTIPEWMPFFKKLSTEIVDVLFHEYKDVWDTALLRPNLSCLNNGYFENEALHENGCDRKILIKQASPMDVMLVTYGLLSNEIESLADKEWNIIALDEAHNIKNKDTKVFKATMQLKGNFRLLLTGTPIQNHLGEIWSLFQFANPGLLGSFTQFNNKFIRPIEKSGDKEKQRLLKKLLPPFILRRTKTEVLDELPEKTEITLYIELNDKERALYENIRLKVLHNLEKGSTTVIQALTEITGLRQAACHPALIDPNLNIPSSKSDSFIKLMKDLIKNNHRALVISQFTSHLALIRKELEKEGIDYLYLDGSMTAEEQNTQVKKFRTGNQPLSLISLKAGETGLNLTAADFVIHPDPWWNPAVEDQASDRVYRIGQTRPVTVYHHIARQTIEEKIIQLHQSKKSLANSLLDENDLSHKLTKKEILELLKRVN